jgi:hypothetical protein
MFPVKNIVFVSSPSLRATSLFNVNLSLLQHYAVDSKQLVKK